MEIQERHLKEISKANANSMVGRICARIEEVQSVNIPENKKFELIKNSIRNYIPETMRDMIFQIECYNKGLQVHKVEFNKNRPTD